MKKKIIISISAVFLIAIGTIGWQKMTYSEGGLAYPNVVSCSDAWTNSLNLIDSEWDSRLDAIVNQDKATSETIDEVFEGLRTYRCMLEYTCEAVLYSIQSDDLTAPIYLTQEQIGRIPGCASPDDVGLPETWEVAVDALFSPFGDKFVYNPIQTHFTYMPQCSIVEQYGTCLAAVNERIACDKDSPIEDCLSKKVGFLKAEKAIFDAAGKKKARIMVDKLSGIANKMLGMEGRVERLKHGISVIDKHLPCFVEKCS